MDSGGRIRIAENDGGYLHCASFRTGAEKQCAEGSPSCDGPCSGIRSQSLNDEQREGNHMECESCRDRRGPGAKDCCLYGNCCFFDCLRQIKKKFGGLQSPGFNYFLNCILNLKDTQDATAVARKKTGHGSCNTIVSSSRKCQGDADLRTTSYLARDGWSNIGRESDCGTKYTILCSVLDTNSIKVTPNSQLVTRTRFLQVLSNPKGDTLSFHIQGREPVCLYLLHVSSSSLSKRHLLQNSCLQMPCYTDASILNSVFLDVKSCKSLDHCPKGNQNHHSEWVLKDGCSEYQHLKASTRSKDGCGAELCRPHRKTFIAYRNEGFENNADIGTHVIDEEVEEDFLYQFESGMQCKKNSSKDLLRKRKRVSFVVDNNNNAAFLDVTHQASPKSHEKTGEKVFGCDAEHVLDTQKSPSNNRNLFGVVEKNQRLSFVGDTCWESSKLSKDTARKQLTPSHNAVLDKGKLSIVDDDCASFSNHIPENCVDTDSFPNNQKKVTSLEGVEKMYSLGETCHRRSKLNKVSSNTKQQLNVYHGSGHSESDPMLLDEDYATFLDQIKGNRMHTSNFTSEQNELLQKDQTTSFMETLQQGDSDLNKDTAKRQLPIHHPDQSEAEPLLVDEDYASFLDHITERGRSYSLRFRTPKDWKLSARKYEKDSAISSDNKQKDDLIFSDNKQQLHVSDHSGQNGVSCSLVDEDYDAFLKRLHVHGNSYVLTRENHGHGNVSGLKYAEDIFSSANLDQNAETKQEDGCNLGNKKHALSGHKLVSSAVGSSREEKSCLIGQKDNNFKATHCFSGIKAEKDVKKDKDYELFLKNVREHGHSYILSLTDTKSGKPIAYKYEEYKENCLLQNSIISDQAVILGDVKRTGSDLSKEKNLLNNRKSLGPPLNVRRSPRLMQLTERQIDSCGFSESILPAKLQECMPSGEGTSADETPGNFNYSFDCGNSESFSRGLHALLRKPYNKKEHEELMKEANGHKPIIRERNLRGHSKTYITKDLGLSYMDHYPDFQERMKVADYAQQLKLLRGFFFWLQNSCREDSFKPWLSSPSRREHFPVDCIIVDG